MMTLPTLAPTNVLKRALINFILFFLLLYCGLPLSAQEGEASQSIDILFYNVENLFDTDDDPLTADEEFLPDGARRWTRSRFTRKINHLAKVIVASCGYQAPAIVGLCEVENRRVVERLCSETPLAAYDYDIVHRDSPDERGIDVALIYRPDVVKPFVFSHMPLVDERGRVMRTREILYAGFIFLPADTLHVFFNHWPSRYSGQATTEPQRMIAAATLRKMTDSLMTKGRPRIIIMGDFNDQPGNRSIAKGLGATATDNPLTAGELINLSARWSPRGTLKYRQTWYVFDQVIVSDFLLNDKSLGSDFDKAAIVDLEFLMEPDPKFKGKRLYRTYFGYQYQGGFSDHLPVRLRLSRY